MIVSDLAIWVYGDDPPKTRKAIHRDLARLIAGAHRIEWRPVTWGFPAMGQSRAYRLVTDAAVREAA